MSYNISGGLLVSILFLTLVIALPVKIGAHLAKAERTGLIWCLVAVLIGMVSGVIFGGLLGGFIGGTLASFLGYVLGIRFVLGTSFLGAIGLTIVSMVLSMVGFALLVNLGFIRSAPIATSLIHT
ncbi:MAG: hypothetical protein QM718_09940 [Steroidobacteraceae bacterium]